MILLTKEDIKKLFSMQDAIEANKECYKQFSEGKFEVPLRAVISGKNGNFLFMPAYNEEMSAVGLKIVNIMPQNPKRNLPASIGQVLLIDGETGQVLSLMDGTYITALRTGAASGAAFDLFGRKNAKVGAIIGTGSQAFCQLEAMLCNRNLEEVRVAARDFEKTKIFVKNAETALTDYNTKLVACDDPNKAVDGADLNTLVTISKNPVCDADYFKPGCIISAVGAYTYDMQELDPKVFTKCGKIFFDSEQAVLSESGDILRPLDEGTLKKSQFTGDIGDFLLGKIPGRANDNEIIVYENVGIGALDLFAANEIYKRAKSEGMGLIWGE